jgi:hypothetical protein
MTDLPKLPVAMRLPSGWTERVYMGNFFPFSSAVSSAVTKARSSGQLTCVFDPIWFGNLHIKECAFFRIPRDTPPCVELLPVNVISRLKASCAASIAEI